MSLEQLVTEIGVKQGKDKSLRVLFRDLGYVYYPTYKNWFFSKQLGRKRLKIKGWAEKLNALKRKVRDVEVLNSLKKKFYDKYWLIYQILCPFDLEPLLPEEFIRGFYTPQARRRLVNPGFYVPMPEPIVEALKTKKQVQEDLNNIKTAIDTWVGKNFPELSDQTRQARKTKIFNDLDGLYDKYDGKNFEAIKEQSQDYSTLKAFTTLDALLEQRKQVSDHIITTNKSLEASMGGRARIRYFKPSETSREHILRVEHDDYDYLRNNRMMSVKELLSQKWCFLDLEIPFWRRKDSQITWIGVAYVENGVKTKYIYTIHDIDVEEHAGYNIIKCKDQEDLIKRVAQDIRNENPFVMSTYHTSFDLIKLRLALAEGFGAGADESNPIYKATVKFFERIGIRDRVVFDFMMWQMTARAFEINAKLDMFAYEKKLGDYDELEEREEAVIAGDVKAGRKIAEYLGDDIDKIIGVFESEEFRNTLEDMVWICDHYKVSLERICHRANNINDVQERLYFENLGTIRDKVPPHLRYKDRKDLETKGRQFFTKKVVHKSIRQKPKKGLSKNLYKVFIPIGDLCKDLVLRNFPEAEALYNYKAQFMKDKKRLFFLNQFVGAFARWILADYGVYLRQVNSLDELLRKNKVGRERFEDLYHNHIRKSIVLRARNGDQYSEKALERLNLADLRITALRNHYTDEVRRFIEHYHIKEKDFLDMVNTRSKIKREGRNSIGNYDLFPDRRFWHPEKKRKPKNIFVIPEILCRGFDEINDFLKNFQVVGLEGHYLYVKEDKQLLEKEDAPVVLVDEIEELWNADKPYHEKLGYYNKIKLKKEPTNHMSVWEMMQYRAELDLLVADNPAEALRVFENAQMELMEDKEWDIRDFLLYTKSKKRYRVFTTEGVVHFVTEERYVPKDKELIRPKEGYAYFEDIISKSGGKKEVIKVQLIEDPSVLKPDLTKYRERFCSKGRRILQPVIKPERSIGGGEQGGLDL